MTIDDYRLWPVVHLYPLFSEMSLQISRVLFKKVYFDSAKNWT